MVEPRSEGFTKTQEINLRREVKQLMNHKSKSMTMKILLVGFPNLISQALRHILEVSEAHMLILEADCGLQGVRDAIRWRPYLVLVYHEVGCLKVVPATRQIHKQCPATHVLWLGEGEGDSHRAREAGAVGCLSLSTDKHTFFDTVFALQQQAPPSSFEVPPLSALTSRQREVLLLLVNGKTIYESALQLKVSPKTIEIHRRNLMERLDRHSIAELTQYAFSTALLSL